MESTCLLYTSHKLERLENRKKYLEKGERQKRTHRLCNLGGTIAVSYTHLPYQIASKLKSEKVLIPSAYLAQHGEGVNKNTTFKDVYGWGSSTICNILEKREYLGHTINCLLYTSRCV